jgi:hypothetical protein
VHNGNVLQRTGENEVLTIPNASFTTPSVRMLVGIEQGDLTPSQAEQLGALVPPTFATYEWYEEENRNKVVEVLKALVRAILDNQQDLIQFFAGAVISVYNHDRAARASALLHQKPIRVMEIPQEKVVKKRGYPDERYILQFTKVSNWVEGIPYERIDLIAKLGQEIHPDAFYLATYQRIQLLPDPILYAKYGDWFVKVAEWE